MTVERCNKACGGTIGCTTFCTKLAGHDGECGWDAGEQIEWNEREVAARSQQEKAP